MFEDFGSLSRGSPVALTDVSLEELKLDAFEKGYQAGWEDAVKSASDDSRSVSADLAQSLRDLTFTYEEAHAAALSALKPLLDQMVASVLPSIAQNTLGLQVSEQLHDLARSHGLKPIEIVVSPANLAVVEQMINQDAPAQTTVVEEPSLAEGQVLLRMGDHERDIDVTQVLDGIDTAIAGFFNSTERQSA
ncbi:MAG: flagellar biosynthesis protein [Roseovarius sp.]